MLLLVEIVEEDLVEHDEDLHRLHSGLHLLGGVRGRRPESC